MKAAVLEHYGSPQEFKVKDVEPPEISSGQVLIRNHASSVNPIDVLVREGKMRLLSGLMPDLTGQPVIGSDFCGTVVQSNSQRFKVGDEVFGFVAATTGHAYAEQVAVDEDVAAPKPTNLSYVEAAVLPLVSITAYQGLTAEGKLQAGQRVLINGCTGGVGSAAVQIAKALGAHVTGTCQGEHIEAARELGCDEVLDYEKQDLPHDHSYDLIFDTAAKLTLSHVEQTLKPEGVLVTTKPDYDTAGDAATSAVDLLKSRMKLVHAKPTTEDLTQLKTWIEQGQLKPYVAQYFPLEQLAQAHEMLEHGGFVGKVGVEIS